MEVVMEREMGMRRMGLSRWFEGKMRKMSVGKEMPSTPPIQLRRMLDAIDGQGDGPGSRRMRKR